MKKIMYLLSASCMILSCATQDQEKEQKKEVNFCNCVNKDYHSKQEETDCKKVEADLKKTLDTASKKTRGEILMKIQECKVQGQYDND